MSLTTDQRTIRKRTTRLLLADGCLLVLLIIAGVLGVKYAYKSGPPRDQIACRKAEQLLAENRSYQALAQFRTALEINPANLHARAGIIQTLISRKQFDQALAEIREAASAGLPTVRGNSLHARLLAARADHRLEAARENANAALCDSIITSEIEPALILAEKSGHNAANITATHTLSGDLYAKKTGLLHLKRHLLAVERNQARNLNKPNLAKGISAEIFALIPELLKAEQESFRYYTRAIETNPAAPEPRLALAKFALSLYTPRLDLAVSALEPLLQAEPSPRRALYLQALAEHAAGKHQAAFRHIRLLRNDQPKDLELWRTEIKILIAQQHWQEADTSTAEFIKLSPAEPPVLYARGLALLARGQANKASALLQSIFSENHRQWPQARFALAKALHHLGNQQQAVTTYMQVLADAAACPALSAKICAEIKQARYQSSLAIARVMSNTENPETAIRHAVGAFMVFPRRADAIAAVERVCVAAGQPERAIPFICLHLTAIAATDGPLAALNTNRKQFNHRARNRDLRLLKARLLADSAQYSDAENILKGLRRDFPTPPLYAHELARVSLLLGRTADARHLYEELFQNDPLDSQALIGLVAILVREADVPTALAFLKRGDPTDAAGRIQSQLLSLYLDGRTPDQAIGHLRSRIEIDAEGSLRTCLLLAQLHWLAGRRAEARAAFQTILRNDPNNPLAYRLGLLNLEENQPRKALALFREGKRNCPGHTGMELCLAVALEATGQHKQALQCLAQLRARTAHSGQTINALHRLLAAAQAYQANGQAESDAAFSAADIEDQFQTLITDYPDLILVRLLHAQYHAEQGNLDHAQNILQAARLLATPEELALLETAESSIRKQP